MSTRLKIAFRNTFRNKRRTALNLIMIAGGVAAIILFRGFANHILVDLRNIVITTQTGHLEVATKAYWDETGSPKDALLADSGRLESAIRKLPHVVYVAGRLNFFGLLSAGDRSQSARGLSLDPEVERAKNESFRIVSGERLSSSKPYGILVGQGLAARLGLVPGGAVTVLAYTYDGAINAFDMEVGGIFESGLSDVDDTTFVMNVGLVKTLLDTDKVEQIVVGLDHTENTGLALAELNSVAKPIEKDAVVRTWRELSHFYQQCDSFFRTQNRVIAVIILALVLLGVLNTIGMSVMERAGEIGTVRALGDPEEMVVVQFVLEGAILGLFGALVGIGLGTALAFLVSSFHIPIVVPSASLPLVIKIDLVPAAYRQACYLAILAAIAAAVGPAVRAARMNIVDALRRAI